MTAFTGADVERIARKCGRASGGGTAWKCRCPAHDDANPSLTLAVGEKGILVYHCHAGCTQDAVRAALERQAGVDFNSQPRGDRAGRIRLDSYVYRAADGTILCRKVRWFPKSFSWERPGPNGGWIKGLAGAKPPLYAADKLAAADTVYACEGEKDCDRLAALGLVATTSPDGASSDAQKPKWYDACSAALAGKRIVFFVDNDAPGVAHASDAAASCRKAGALSVKIVRFTAMRQGADVSDWLDEGRGRDELLALVDATPEWVEREPADDPEPFEPIDFPALVGKAPPERAWTVEGWIPARTVTSLYGGGGIGKSMLAQQVATCLATGVSAFGFRVSRPVPVVGFFAEDDDDELWRRQCRINGAVGWTMEHLRKLHVQGRAGLDNALVLYAVGQEPQVRPLFARVVRACERYRPGLLVLDNIAQLFGGDENNRYQVTHFCNLLIGVAARFDCGALLLGHPSKADGSEYSGNTAWNAAVRSRLLLCNKDGQLKLTRPKANYAAEDELPLAWVDGVLRPLGGGGLGPNDEAAVRACAAAAERAFLAALDRLAAAGIALSDSVRAGNYAPREIERHNLLDGHTKREMGQAMVSLIASGAIVAGRPIGKGPNRHKRVGLARATCGDER